MDVPGSTDMTGRVITSLTFMTNLTSLTFMTKLRQRMNKRYSSLRFIARGYPPMHHYLERLKYCTARSCFSASARVAKVPRFRRRPLRGSFFREYKRYWPDLSFRIML